MPDPLSTVDGLLAATARVHDLVRGITHSARSGQSYDLLVSQLQRSWLLSLLIAGCQLTTGTGMIDGFPVGAPYDCATPNSTPCDVIVSMAQGALDARDPSHAGVASVALYREDRMNPNIAGGPVIRSGTLVIVVFRLVDGSTRATGVHCGVPPCTPFPRYPQ